MSDQRSSVLRGAAAGAVGTLAMTLTMLAAERLRLLPGPPPELIVERLRPGLDRPSRRAAALVMHVGYGTVAGAALALVAPRTGRRPAAGAGYGLLLWVAGYEGWVPMLGVLPFAHRDRPTRVGSMIVAHAVYGAATAEVLRRLAR